VSCEDTHDLASFGWTDEAGNPVKLKHNWKVMCENIRKYITTQLNDGLLQGFQAGFKSIV
jgi:hypothetical protein